jgi:broad specificity phosphatase PhoE
MILNLFFIRHGFAYNNAVSKLTGIYCPLHKLCKDPSLTEFGKLTSSELANMLSFEPDLILSSVLLRSIETALYMFPTKSIVVVPHLSENLFGLDNTVSTIDRHKLILKNNFDRVDYQFVRNKANPNYFSNDSQLPSFEKFLHWLAENITMVTQIHSPEINIAIVTHSYLMYHHIPINQPYYPKNNAILKQVYQIQEKDGKNYIDLHIHQDKAEKIFDGIDVPSLVEFNKTENIHKNNNSLFWNLMFGAS